MKLIVTTLLATAAFSGGAIAGSFEAPVAAVAPLTVIEPAGTDWGGLYVGGMYTFETGNWEGFDENSSFGNWEAEGEKYGAFAGYNIQRGALVYGGELAYSVGDTTFTALQPGSDGNTSDTFLDAKARLGYVLNDILIYGVAGGSWATSETSGNPPIELDGFNYGAGAQMKFGNGMFAGVEYLIRDLAGDNPINPDISYEYVNQSLELRAGWQF